jgi:Holliday junction resolvase RusA-like endonuclease
MRYRAFADELRLKYGKELPHSVELVFHMPMPKSWSKKKRELMLGKPHQQRPDWDNLSKAVCDALVKEDSVIWRCMATKLWAEEGSITIKEFPDEERW